MTLPVRTAAVVERWDCHGCGRCCRAVIVPLSDEDVARLRSQHWDEHPEYRGVRIMVRHGLWKKSYRLALDGQQRCVFLTAQGRCRIHELHGEPAKPLLCRTFPFQLVPLERESHVTLRRHCPAAAADIGHTLEEQLGTIRELAAQRRDDSRPAGPPPITPAYRGTWPDFLRMTDALERFLLDRRYPLVRRVAHGLKFCDLLQRCRLRQLSGERLADLVVMLENSAVEEAGPLFIDRRPAGRAAELLFRQTTLEYVRLHPDCMVWPSWGERGRLVVAAMAFARGRGRLPRLHPSFPRHHLRRAAAAARAPQRRGLAAAGGLLQSGGRLEAICPAQPAKLVAGRELSGSGVILSGGDVDAAVDVCRAGGDARGHAGRGWGDRSAVRPMPRWPAGVVAAEIPRSSDWANCRGSWLRMLDGVVGLPHSRKNAVTKSNGASGNRFGLGIPNWPVLVGKSAMLQLRVSGSPGLCFQGKLRRFSRYFTENAALHSSVSLFCLSSPHRPPVVASLSSGPGKLPLLCSDPARPKSERGKPMLMSLSYCNRCAIGEKMEIASFR